ncbi:MAG TPA: undecaprenyl-phosphate glucose phosphotransferase [Nitrospira sp.]|nr:undecaprenyl-phosphate glucose phosphotransferase [Nitrospira sp.]
MLTRHTTPLLSIVVMLDLALMACAWRLAGSNETWPLVPMSLLWMITAWLFDLHRLAPMRSARHEIRDVVAGNTCFVGVLIAASLLFLDRPLQAELLTTFWLFHLIGLGSSRGALRSLLENAGQWSWTRRVAVIVGTGPVARRLAQRLRRTPEYGIVLHGFVSDGDSPVGRMVDGVPVIGELSDLRRLAASGIDVVLLCLPPHLERYAETFLHQLRNSTVDVKLIPSIAATDTLGLEAYMFEGLPMITLQGAPVYGWHQAGKRALDLVGSVLGLVLAAPLFVLIAVLVKASSPGPVLYRQVRMSLAGQPFVMLKFRTMYQQAEHHIGPVWAVPQDPRVTKIGRLLRKTSLDELPQLWNVLKGEMSLVGPRPERPTHIEVFRLAYPAYMLRLKVKAGMTGWAQINGWRGNTSLQHRVAHDLYYIQHWSLWFDLKILCQTVWKGLMHENAY